MHEMKGLIFFCCNFLGGRGFDENYVMDIHDKIIAKMTKEKIDIAKSEYAKLSQNSQ
jgi:hypothetical protein